MQEEHVVRILHNVQGQIGLAGMPRLYDLVITDSRLVGIMKKNLTGAMALGGSFGAIGGAAAGKIVSDAAKQMSQYEPGELDRLVAAEKTSFSLAWNSIERGRITGLVTKNLELRAGGKKYYLKFSKQALRNVEGDLLNRIPTLKR